MNELIVNHSKFNENRQITFNPGLNNPNCTEKSKNSFEMIDNIGSGGFGKIIRVKNNVSGKEYAMKKLWIKGFDTEKSILEEIEMNKKLNSKFVVELIDFWTDKDFSYILMELCVGNLRELLDEKPAMFGLRKNMVINSLEFYLSLNLLFQLIACVKYLHSYEPPIMHRDLKPENVLIADRSDGPFLKLCDFGLAKFFNSNKNTLNVGTNSYMAPEVKTSFYDLQADIYSLGVISKEIFNFHRTLKFGNLPKCEGSLKRHFDLLKILFNNMTENDDKLRKNSTEILEEVNNLKLDFKTSKRTIVIMKNLRDLRSSKFSYIFEYFLKCYKNEFGKIKLENYSKLKTRKNRSNVIYFPYLDFNAEANYFNERIHNNGNLNKNFKITDFSYSTGKINEICDQISELRKLDNDKIVKIRKFTFVGSYLYIYSIKSIENFENIIHMKANAFGRQRKKPIGPTEFYISYELFFDLSDTLNYLHTLEIPIVHRDLKPSNIIVYNELSGIKIKLSNIGLGQKLETIEPKAFYATNEQSLYDYKYGWIASNTYSTTSSSKIFSSLVTRTESLTSDYQAPEVISGCHYNTKADIYSLGMIGLDLFGIETIDNLKSDIYLKLFDGTVLEIINRDLIHILSSCVLSADSEDRPDCETILCKLKELKSIFKKIPNLSDELVMKYLSEFENTFYIKYLTSKFQASNYME